MSVGQRMYWTQVGVENVESREGEDGIGNVERRADHRRCIFLTLIACANGGQMVSLVRTEKAGRAATSAPLLRVEGRGKGQSSHFGLDTIEHGYAVCALIRTSRCVRRVLPDDELDVVNTEQGLADFRELSLSESCAQVKIIGII